MLKKSIEFLKNDTYRKTIEFQQSCKDHDIDLLIYCTNRSLEEQARLYRKSRTTSEIQRKINKFRKNGFGFLADILENVGKQFGIIGEHSTYACCGESFHNYGNAFDFVPLDNGEALWDYDNNKDIWDIAGTIGIEIGLQWGGRFKNFFEPCHFQINVAGNPLKLFNHKTIKEMLGLR